MIPKFPPPEPRIPKNKSSFLHAVAVTNRPSARMTRNATTLSIVQAELALEKADPAPRAHDSGHSNIGHLAGIQSIG